MRQTECRIVVATHAKGTTSFALSDDDECAERQIRTWADIVPVPATWTVKNSALREATAPEAAA